MNICRGGVCAGKRTIPDNGEHGEGFFHCPSCGNAFQPPPRGVEVECDLTFSHIPKVLKGCLHTICQNCAEDGLQRSENASSIKCPLCGLTTSDVITTSALQDNIMALQDLHRKNSYCDFCDDDTVQASHVCDECESLLCTFHVKAHAVSRGTKSHTVASLTEKARKGAELGILHCVPITCARHAGVPAKLFCSEPCGATICHNCSVTEHSGHTVYLADSEEVELLHRTGLTRRGVSLGHSLAKVQGALDAVEAVKTGVEQHSRMAEKSAVQVFASIRAAVDSREKAVLENLQADRASKLQDLNKQLNELTETIKAYAAALDTTNESLKYLHGNQLLAMEPTLRECLDKHEANFLSEQLEPCSGDRVEFEYDRDIAIALRLGISQVGYLAQTKADFGSTSDRTHKRGKPRAPEQEVHTSWTSNGHDIHFTLAAIVGARPQEELTLATPTDVVIVEIRNGSELEFLKNGKPGPVIGRVALHTKLKGARHLKYESEHFFESLSQQAAPKWQQRKQLQEGKQQQELSSCHEIDDGIPTVRFTKTLRVSGRRQRVEGSQSPV